MRQIDNMTSEEIDVLKLKGMLGTAAPAQAQHSPIISDLARKAAKLCNETGGYATKFAEDEFYEIIASALRQFANTKQANAQRLADAFRKIAERDFSGVDKSWRTEAIEMQDEAREALAEWSKQK